MQGTKAGPRLLLLLLHLERGLLSLERRQSCRLLLLLLLLALVLHCGCMLLHR